MAFFEACGTAPLNITLKEAGSFVLAVILLSVLYSFLFYIFLLFAARKGALFAVAVPVMLLVMILLDRFPDTMGQTVSEISYGIVAGAVYVIWLILHLAEDNCYIDLIFCFLSDAVMIYVYFSGTGLFLKTITGKAAYAVLLVLTAANFRKLFRKKDEYPFAFFALILMILICIPVREKPINWEPVIDMGRKAVSRIEKMFDSLSYYISDMGIGSSYHSGYSSYAQTGNAIELSEHTEIEVKTIDNTVLNYTDEETGEKIRRRRTVYLTGGVKPDKERILDVLFSFYTHNVDTSDAYLYAKMSEMDISYVYLKTNDEIMPEFTFMASDDEGSVLKGRSDKKHKKGYEIESQYLDLDMGSPYIREIVSTPVSHIMKADVSYKTMSVYAFELFGLRLGDLFDEEEYAVWQNDERSYDAYLVTDGATERMRDLAADISEGYLSDYEKCKAVEAFLRQYKYATDVSVKEGASTKDEKGMNKLADQFLFESGKGYCVHFSSAMVMLLRLNGIPARLVSGYRYVFPFEKSTSYDVAGKYAHAWPEAYIDGFGWVSFEPTSAMSTAEDRTWHRHPSALDKGEIKDGYHTGISDPYRDDNSSKPYPAPAVEITETEDRGRNDIDRLKEALKLLFIIITAAFIMVILILLFTMIFKYLRYKYASPNKRLILDVNDITSLVSRKKGLHENDRGVLSDYIPYIPEELRSETEEVFNAYYRIKYRCIKDDDNTESVIAGEEECARELRKKLKKGLLLKTDQI